MVRAAAGAKTSREATAGVVALGCLLGTATSASALAMTQPHQATVGSTAAATGGTSGAAASGLHLYQFIEARHSGKDLAVENNSTSVGAHIVQFTRNTGHNQQLVGGSVLA
jgi:hypothetical protein